MARTKSMLLGSANFLECLDRASLCRLQSDRVSGIVRRGTRAKCSLIALTFGMGLVAGQAHAEMDPETRAAMLEFKAEINGLKKQVQTLTGALQKAQRNGYGRRQQVAAVATPLPQPSPPSIRVANAPALGSPTVVSPAQTQTGTAAPQQKPQFGLAELPRNQLPASAQPVSPSTLETTTLNSAANNGPRGYFERKAGKTLTFFLPGGEITAYGNLDVSFDAATKGYPGKDGLHGTFPVGRGGWLPDISTNLSFVGLRGFEKIPNQPFQFVYQLETQIDISATSGIGENNSAESNAVKGGLTSRNTYIGVAEPAWGSVLIGKTDAPYKVSTARLNPFLGEWGDNAAIMGNTGGDNRVEFGTRLDHSIWYESPQFLGGLKANLLYSPGQNRSSNSDNIASGESDCTGGNIPGSGGSVPFACNDGGFSDALSLSLTYTHGPLYVALAYERHEKVNRASDLTGEYAKPPSNYFSADVAPEDAAKIGVQYSLPIGLTLDAIFERLHRYDTDSLDFQNERSRNGTWLAATQILTPRDNISIGWAYAGRTPGDPGQHNTSLETPPLGALGDATGGADRNNTANLVTIAYKHELGAGLSVYVDWAAIFNGPYAHYALGAGGRGVTTDCHDASDATGGESSDPHCFAGSTPMGTSVGLRYRF